MAAERKPLSVEPLEDPFPGFDALRRAILSGGLAAQTDHAPRSTELEVELCAQVAIAAIRAMITADPALDRRLSLTGMIAELRGYVDKSDR